MLRIALCLMFALMSSAAVAREVKLSSPNGGGCPDEETSSHPDEPATSEAPSREARIKQAVHSDLPVGRSQSTRWHSFLPGMLR